MFLGYDGGSFVRLPWTISDVGRYKIGLNQEDKFLKLTVMTFNMTAHKYFRCGTDWSDYMGSSHSIL